jgi:hypothetical protein
MRVLALRHDPLKPHLAGVRKHERAILVVEVLVEAQPRCRTPEQARERRLAHCERVAPQVVAGGCVGKCRTGRHAIGPGDTALSRIDCPAHRYVRYALFGKTVIYEGQSHNLAGGHDG